MFKLRQATREDIPQCLAKAKSFITLYEDDKLFDMKTIVFLFLTLIDNGIFLVCEKDGNICGGFGAVIVPHYFNASLLIGSEVFWWVDEDVRTGKPALLLFNGFLKEAETKKLNLVSISKLYNSNLKDEFLEKRGFVIKEKGFYKWL